MIKLPGFARKSLTLAGAVISAASLLVASGCGDDSGGGTGCSSVTDCGPSQVCSFGACQAPAPDGVCQTSNECLRGFQCVDNMCTETSTPSNNDPVNNDPVNNDPVNNDPVNNEPPPDTTPPEVVSVVPGDGTTGVARDVNVVVTFNEPILDLGLENKVAFVKLADRTAVAFQASHTNGVLTIDPAVDLEAGTAYEVVVKTDIADQSSNPLALEHRVAFLTAAEQDAVHGELANRFAPVIHQEVDADATNGRMDYFTALDFDDDLLVNNNYAAFRQRNIPGRAYYNVVESQSHYFIQYLFYYPGWFDEQGGGNRYEHDVTTTQVVVNKTGEAVELVESCYRTACVAFKPEGSPAADGNDDFAHTYGADGVWNDTHFRAYHGKNLHGACAWTWSPGALQSGLLPWCRHDSSNFVDAASSVVYYPSTSSTGPNDITTCGNGAVCDEAVGLACDAGVCKAPGGSKGATYSLQDFNESMWLHRVSISESIAIFQPNASSLYEPGASTPADRPGVGEQFLYPSRLAATQDNNRGQLPFGFETGSGLGAGQHWVDPAYSLERRYNLGDTWSQTYCYNLFFGIDARGQSGCPTE